MTDEEALARARECRRIATEVATTRIARENWYYLAEHWEHAAQAEEPLSSSQRRWQVESQTMRK